MKSVHEQIRKVLNVSYTTYRNYQHTQFEKWCSVYATKLGICKRQLISNEHLFNWYCTQWVFMVENIFYNEHKEYIENNVEHAAAYWDLFKDYPVSIQAYFPGVLLNMIKDEQKPAIYE